MTTRTNPDARVAAAAARRHGIVTRALAKSCGMTDRMIAGRVRSGEWEVLARGVYRLTGVPETPAGRAYAGVLVVSGDAVASAATALALLGVGTFPVEPMLIVPPSGSSRRPGFRVRRSPIEPQDRTVLGVVPATTAARSLLDLAPLVDEEVLDERVDDVLDRRLASPSQVLSVIRRAPVGHGRWGAPRLRDALEPWLDGVRPGSPAEVRLMRRIADWGLPRPVKQHPVDLGGGRRVFLDLAWPESLAALEYDGRRYHGPRHLAHDVEREELVREQGWWIGRVDRTDLVPSSTRVRDELRSRLLRRAA